MGRLAAEDMAAHADIDSALSWHLRCNHYPPVPSSMIQPCKAAIEACNEGNTDRIIPLPAGVSWRDSRGAPAWAIVASHHLEPWLEEIE